MVEVKNLSHDHSHATASTNRNRLLIAFGITATILIAEIIGAFWTGSLALLTDAGHMLTDTAGLFMALIATQLTLRPADNQRTWGMRRAEVIAAGFQALILFAVGVFVIIEGIRRIANPVEIEGTGLLIFGIIGLAGNLISLAALSGGRGSNLNMRAAFLEVINDALGSVAVIISAIVVQTTGWVQADAIAGMLIAILILPRALIILRESGSILLESTPKGLDLDEVREHILGLPHVLSVHDLHASEISTGFPTLSAHVILDDSCFHDNHAPQILDSLQACVKEHFPVSIEHTTFQLEPASHSHHEFHTHS
ncbi:cation diffusion facilitator family transporter [Flaviflexus massiliensis]|uniref:cation diffusion facilitator family transporter n=1 Tax=Flaviflexus massiliensis TaxID=1522309 RepID=UPI000B198442|nr:cation diffusion facilitator family transporter [Flaviflexus massiliensis]